MISLLLAIAIAADPPSAPPSKDAPKDKMICRHVEETGTRMGGRSICKLESEWRSEEQSAQDIASQRQRGTLDVVPYTGPPKP